MDNEKTFPGGKMAAVLACLSLAVALVAEAQYFGRNKVQYKDLDFRVLETEHFDIYYYPEEEEAVRLAARMAERWYERFLDVFQANLRGRQPLILYASHPDFQQTNAISSLPGEGTGGVTESLKRRIVLPFTGTLQGTDHVIGHELVHAFQYSLAGADNASPSTARLPLWFVEGMAEYLSVGPVDAHTAMWLRDAVRRDELPTIEDLGRPEFFPYRYGQALFAYIGGRWGDPAIGKILRSIGMADTAVGAIEGVVGMSAAELSEDWHEELRSYYRPFLREKELPEDVARAIITEESEGGRINVAPALSPDGQKLAFLSERDIFAIELFLADVESGQVERKILETATDPHFESIQFIESSGAWSPDGRRFAFAAIHQGRPVLSILDVEEGDVVREIRFSDLGEVKNPTFSPDGKKIAFSGLQGGLTDLFTVDLDTETRERLTQDVYSDLQPAWSPDGTRIVFVTDRFGGEPLAPGEYRLATIDLQSGQVTALPSFRGSKHVNPSWAGENVFFISDRNGISNVYRLDTTSNQVFQVTDLASGVSGITDLSPALSVSARGERLVFSAFEADGYEIYAIDDSRRIAGRSSGEDTTGRMAALLPPRERSGALVATYLDRPAAGLPEPSKTYDTRDYNPSLALDYIGQPYLVGGTDPLGTYIGGGIALFWSDMLGNHNLGTQIQANGDFENIGGTVAYQNNSSRWGWGGIASRLPFRSAGFRSQITETDQGEPALVRELIEFRQIETRAAGLLTYPFNRAQRFEISAGFRNIDFARESRVQAFSLVTGGLLADETRDLPEPNSLNLGEGNAALVYDTSLFGPVSPILGTRYRLQGGGSYGSLDFSTALADFRHYFMPAMPFTIATRVLHYGRYAGDAEDSRLAAAFIGYPDLVRGYEQGSFSLSECEPTAESDCPVFDQLFGSKMLVANVELRFPLVGAFRGELDYGPLPVEMALFADAGVAWTSDVDPFFVGGDRDPVSSVGVAFRVGVLQFLALEFDLVRPLERPQEGWLFQFAFRPGF